MLPTVDLRRLSGGGSGSDNARDALRRIVGGIGAFYLVGHEIAQDDADRMFALTRRFFALPEPDRRSIAMVNSPHFRGYTAPGHELTQGRPDWREEVDIGAERAARDPALGAPYWRLHGPNQWPAALPDLRPAVLEWIDRLRAVAARLASALAESLGLARDEFDSAFEPDPHLLLKLIRYPGRADNDRQGVGAHRDSGFLTFVLQDDRGGSGLQFFDGSAFVDVAPQRGAFVVNLGEAFELATARRVRATLHRVQSPPAGSDYVSIPFFFNPRFDYVVKPLRLAPGVIAPSANDLPVDPADPIFAEYGYNALKGRLRSHRDVAERYFRDVELTPAARSR